MAEVVLSNRITQDGEQFYLKATSDTEELSNGLIADYRDLADLPDSDEVARNRFADQWPEFAWREYPDDKTERFEGWLSVRKTRRYVGTYQHLDEWEDVCQYREAARGPARSAQTSDEEDPCDPRISEVFIEVNEVVTDTRIRDAIEDSYTQDGCACEHDCCGCRSYHVHTVDYLRKNYWRVVVTSSRNF